LSENQAQDSGFSVNEMADEAPFPARMVKTSFAFARGIDHGRRV